MQFQPKGDEVLEEEILSLKQICDLPRKIRKSKKIVADLVDTKYNVIFDVMQKTLGWRVYDTDAEYIDDWHLRWVDTYISEDDLRKMLPFQKINHFPGSQILGRKNELSRNLAKMKKLHPVEYDFSPRTWLLPVFYYYITQPKKNQYQAEELRQFHYSTKKPVYIVKPEASCQGKGIFLTKKIEHILEQRFVVQEYLKNPLLIDELKFDLRQRGFYKYIVEFRIYVLLKSVCPLKIFMYQDGLARFSTKKYVKPSKKNLSSMMMHLTNYAINKKSRDFVFNKTSDQDSIGHKRSFTSVLKVNKKSLSTYSFLSYCKIRGMIQVRY